jgi:ubiquitin C-terminal hydrolase
MFELPNSNGIRYEICGIAFHNPAPDGLFGHYWTYIKYRDGWINLDCSKYEIATLKTSFVKNNFRASLKLPGGAHANMLILKRKV